VEVEELENSSEAAPREANVLTSTAEKSVARAREHEGEKISYFALFACCCCCWWWLRERDREEESPQQDLPPRRLLVRN